MTYAGSERKLQVRMREDLSVTEHFYRGDKYLVVNDRVAGSFHRLNEQEFALLSALDGTGSLESIKSAFEARFAPDRITYAEIQAYVLEFHERGLIASTASERGQHLYHLGKKQQRKKNVQSAKNVLAIRTRGINPAPLLSWLTPVLGWFFSKWMVALNVLFWIAALFWLASNCEEFLARLPSMQEYFALGNLTSLILATLLLKIAHELGHGISLTRLGGRCHELGVMLLVLLPTLYINTSDSWRLPNKWHRAAVAAAGVYVELTIAAAATFAWWFCYPGALQYFCLNLMLLASVSSLLFNANPLLKFDGYYVLSDLIEIPNLRQRSGLFVRNAMLSSLLGMDVGDEYAVDSRTKVWLAGYAVAAFSFRLLLVYGIAFFLVATLRPAGLSDVAKFGSGALIGLTIAMPLVGVWSVLKVPGKADLVSTRHRWWALAVLLLIGFVICAVPLPSRVVAEFVIEPERCVTVYANTDAQLRELFVKPGDRVVAGDKIARLENLDLEIEASVLSGKLRQLAAEEQSLRMSRSLTAEMAVRKRVLEEEQRTLSERLLQLNALQAGLLVRAPCAGQIIDRYRLAQPQTPEDLGSWQGWIFNPENRNAKLGRGEAICDVGDAGTMIAKVVIDQRDVRLLEVGQRVELALASRARQRLSSSLKSISEADAGLVAASIAHGFGGSIETSAARDSTPSGSDLNRSDELAARQAIYQALVPLPESASGLESGLRGTARIVVGNTTLLQKLYRFLHRTFRIEL